MRQVVLQFKVRKKIDMSFIGDCLDFEPEEAFATLRKEKLLQRSMLDKNSKDYIHYEKQLQKIGHAAITESLFASQQEAIR